GLFSTLARGPWVGAAVVLLTYLAIGPNAIANLGKVAMIGIVGVALLSVTPVGSRLIEMLPFVGTTDQENVTYRQKLFENSVAVVQRNPLFGAPDFRLEPEMKEMVQGEGIQDIVNTYLEIAMKFGLVGLSLFVGIFASIILRLRRVLKFQVVKDINF